jgi:hypothetical protein
MRQEAVDWRRGKELSPSQEERHARCAPKIIGHPTASNFYPFIFSWPEGVSDGLSTLRCRVGSIHLLVAACIVRLCLVSLGYLLA